MRKIYPDYKGCFNQSTKQKCVYIISLISTMGKRSGKKKRDGQPRKKVKKEWKDQIIPNENEMFQQYYQLQLNLQKEDFDAFWSTMKDKLPVVFRVNPNCSNYEGFCNKITQENFIKNIMPVEPIENQLHEPTEEVKLELIKWYPGDVVYTLNTSKQIFKKSKVLAEFHKYLQKSFDSGLISRQELVSMLPPLYLNLNSDDIVLDMCAAPGSKTSQILQMIYGDKRWLAKGCVIANDADYSRAQMLIHQLHRSGTAGMAVINHPGQFLPELQHRQVGSIKFKFQFDKILCDVPCSGDGATRKLPIKWANWHTSDGMVLHPLQLSILMKAINLLKKDGYLVYSTCSLNPIQNQAVISGLFDKVQSGLELIDIHPMFGVKGRKGLLNWKVYKISDQKTEMKNQKEENQPIKRTKYLEEIPVYDKDKVNYKVKPSMFPPSIERAKQICLDHTMRILPHDQNSGGFFVALLRKKQNFQWKYKINTKEKAEQKDELQIQQQFLEENQPQVQQDIAKSNEEDEIEEKIVENRDDEEQEEMIEKEQQVRQKKDEKQGKKFQKGDKKKRIGSKYEVYQNMDQEEYENLRRFYGLDEKIKNLLYVRQDVNSRKKVLIVSEGVRNFLQADKQKKIKLVNMGCQAFEKGKESFAGNECLYRLCQDGIHFVLNFINLRKVRVPLSFWKQAIEIKSLSHEQIEDIDTREQIKAMSQGSFCIYIREEIGGKLVEDAMVGQNFRNSFHLMVSKQDTASLGMRYL